MTALNVAFEAALSSLSKLLPSEDPSPSCINAIEQLDATLASSRHEDHYVCVARLKEFLTPLPKLLASESISTALLSAATVHAIFRVSLLANYVCDSKDFTEITDSILDALTCCGRAHNCGHAPIVHVAFSSVVIQSAMEQVCLREKNEDALTSAAAAWLVRYQDLTAADSTAAVLGGLWIISRRCRSARRRGKARHPFFGEGRTGIVVAFMLHKGTREVRDSLCSVDPTSTSGETCIDNFFPFVESSVEASAAARPGSSGFSVLMTLCCSHDARDVAQGLAAWCLILASAGSERLMAPIDSLIANSGPLNDANERKKAWLEIIPSAAHTSVVLWSQESESLYSRLRAELAAVLAQSPVPNCLDALLFLLFSGPARSSRPELRAGVYCSLRFAADLASVACGAPEKRPVAWAWCGAAAAATDKPRNVARATLLSLSDVFLDKAKEPDTRVRAEAMTTWLYILRALGNVTERADALVNCVPVIKLMSFALDDLKNDVMDAAAPILALIHSLFDTGDSGAAKLSPPAHCRALFSAIPTWKPGAPAYEGVAFCGLFSPAELSISRTVRDSVEATLRAIESQLPLLNRSDVRQTELHACLSASTKEMWAHLRV
jgi:hypothetical protein